MKILAFSDLQAHEFSQCSYKTDDGLNSRLVDAGNVLDEIREKCVKGGIKYAFFGGDMFQTRGTINTLEMIYIFKKIEKFARDGVRFVAIPGNHDYAKSPGFKDYEVHSLYPFKFVKNNVVLNKFDWYHFQADELSVLSVPFSQNKKLITQTFSKPAPAIAGKIRISLAHIGILEVARQHRYDVRECIKLANIPSDHFDFMLFGHFHTPHKVRENLIIIGSPIAQNFGETGLRGYWILDTDTGKSEFCESKAPRFVVLNSIEEADTKPLKGNFVRVACKLKDVLEVKKILDSKGVRSMTFKYIREAPEQKRAKLDSDLGDNKMIESFTKVEAERTDLNKEKLIKMGVGYMKKVREV